jgi:hypothetical protein
MPEAVAHEVLERGFSSASLSTVGPDRLAVYSCRFSTFVRTADLGPPHRGPRPPRVNVDHEPRVCFEVDEPGQVVPTGASMRHHRGIPERGDLRRIRVVEERDAKVRVLRRVDAKYGDPPGGVGGVLSRWTDHAVRDRGGAHDGQGDGLARGRPKRWPARIAPRARRPGPERAGDPRRPPGRRSRHRGRPRWRRTGNTRPSCPRLQGGPIAPKFSARSRTSRPPRRSWPSATAAFWARCSALSYGRLSPRRRRRDREIGRRFDCLR